MFYLFQGSLVDHLSETTVDDLLPGRSVVKRAS